jgi:(1->4)-alpha-D-glucan 1-alpha-D-glucosylmutase
MAQTLLKLMSPGVPDIYQGTEVWDLSLVDPDNRRPVDFDRLAGLLDEVAALADADVPDIGRILDGADVGLTKLWVTAMALATRRRHQDALGPTGSYEPILADGAGDDDVIAFVRGGEVVPVVPRRIRDDWADTLLVLPDGPWRDVLSGRSHAGGRTRVAALLEGFPVALLTRMPEVP